MFSVFFVLIWINFSRSSLQKFILCLLYVSEIHEAQGSETRTLARGVNEFVAYDPRVCTCLVLEICTECT